MYIINYSKAPIPDYFGHPTVWVAANYSNCGYSSSLSLFMFNGGCPQTSIRNASPRDRPNREIELNKFHVPLFQSEEDCYNSFRKYISVNFDGNCVHESGEEMCVRTRDNYSFQIFFPIPAVHNKEKRIIYPYVDQANQRCIKLNQDEISWDELFPNYQPSLAGVVGEYEPGATFTENL